MARSCASTLLLAPVVALALSGCETISYYLQAAGGQLSLMSRARPLAEVLADPATPEALRARLAVAREVRDYAVARLALPDNASYRAYAELGRPYAVWNVVAAPEFSLEPVQSCFPVAGCVAYRGFFSPEAAEAHAARLRAEGDDVHVYGVPAYSTLGRFDDPLLSTFIRYPDAELARLIFHELAHQVAYARDDSAFNESFAAVVEREGVRRWLGETGRAQEMARYLASRRRSEAMLALVQQARARLQALYRSRLAPEAMRERKRAELEDLRAKLAGYRGSQEGSTAAAPNNAFLASYATYTELVPDFEHLLREKNGDLRAFYEQVRRYAASAPSSRGPLSRRTP